MAQRVGNGVLEEKKEKSKKKKSDEDVVRLKQLVFFFSILVALKVLYNLEFVFHLTLRLKKNKTQKLIH